MAYVSGSRTGAANPAEDLYDLISAQLGAHANYTFIEDYTTGTTKWSVWRCNGAANSAGVDFYVLFNRPTTAGTTLLYVTVCEAYDVATHQFFRAAAYASSTSRTPAADGSVGGTSGTVLPNSWLSNPAMRSYLTITDSSAYDYWIAVNNDGLWVGTRVGVNVYGFAAGTFDSLVQDPAVNDPYPIFAGNYQGNGTSDAANSSTRHPLVTASTGYLWGLRSFWNTSMAWPGQALTGLVGSVDSGDLFQGKRVIGARVPVVTWADERGQPSGTHGKNRGLYRHMLYFNRASGVALGDTVTIGAATYAWTGLGNVWYETTAA